MDTAGPDTAVLHGGSSRGFSTIVLTRFFTIVLLIAALPSGSASLSATGGAQPPPSLEQVLSRAAQYVTTFHQQLSGIVAEETYIQSARTLRGRNASPHARTSLKSDLLLVRPPHADRYVEFRDVFEIDGTAVRDRDERLTKLFLSTSASVDRIRAIVDESARHNIGDIPRNVNTPMLPLYFLQPDKQRQFRFRRAKSGLPVLGTGAAMPGRSAAMFRVTTEIWIVEFSEKERPTIIKTERGRDFPATGRFWINPDTGAVLMSELVMENAEVAATINVSYQSEPMLGFLVPVEMRERYRTRDEHVEGVASYGRFRQAQVTTNEIIAKPPPSQR